MTRERAALDARPLTLRLPDGAEHTVRVGAGGRVQFEDGTVVAVAGDGAGEVRVGDDPPRQAWVAATADARWVFYDGEVHRFDVVRPGARRRAGSHHAELTAPMPATVRQIRAAEGQAVRKGETLIVLEAMKMELPVKAPADGIVSAVHCREGELVQPGVSLMELE